MWILLFHQTFWNYTTIINDDGALHNSPEVNVGCNCYDTRLTLTNNSFHLVFSDAYIALVICIAQADTLYSCALLETFTCSFTLWTLTDTVTSIYFIPQYCLTHHWNSITLPVTLLTVGGKWPLSRTSSGQATQPCICPFSCRHQYSFQNKLYNLFCMQDNYPN